jgi:hypothetical protein
VVDSKKQFEELINLLAPNTAIPSNDLISFLHRECILQTIGLGLRETMEVGDFGGCTNVTKISILQAYSGL